MRNKKIAAVFAAFMMAAMLGGCSAGAKNSGNNPPMEQEPPIGQETELPEENNGETQTPEVHMPEGNEAKPVSPPAVPAVKKIAYIMVTSGGVNIRSGAGTNYSVRGTAEKSTLYPFCGQTGEWIKTTYQNGNGYIHSSYCKTVEFQASDNEVIETVIAEGGKYLGVPYVYGATRYHDGNGRLISGFTVNEFDCSSLMQYIFKKGADINLKMNTRTQIYQGKTLSKSELKRGDLMFFTNASRQNNTGIERVGHVALYLGDNYILHTASDYAKIEQITPLRWSYFIQGQRVI